MGAHKNHLTRRRVFGASAIGVAPTGAAAAGSYRGDNHAFTFSVPSSAWKTDEHQYNVLTLGLVRGSGGTECLSAGTCFDRMDLLA